MDELEAIVSQMKRDGKNQAEIDYVVGEWSKRNPGKTSNYFVRSKGFSSKLPEVTSEITALGEKQGIQRLKKMFGGLGWEFKELPAFEGGLFFDRIVAISPPDENGNRKEQMFEFDLDIGIPAIGKSKNSEGDNEISGDFWESSQALSIDIGAGQVAEELNKFIRDNTNLTGINEQTYNQAWNYANSLEIDTKDMSSEQLQKKVEDVYTQLMFDDTRLPGADRIFKEINDNLETFAAEEIIRIKNKYDTSTQKGVNKANEELRRVISMEQQRLFNNSTELVHFSKGVEKALESRYGIEISDKKRREAENMHLPSWVTASESDMIRQAYVTAAIKLPKAWEETQILHRGMDLGRATQELEKLKNLDPNETYVDDRGRSRKGYTNAARIRVLKNHIYNINKKLVEDFASQQEYQERLKDIRVPTAFGKDISDPDLTIDEWQGMLGDQIVQMISSVISVGGSTYIQEGGGAALDIIELEAAIKRFPVSSFATEEELFDEPKKPITLPHDFELMTPEEKKQWQEEILKPNTVDYEKALKAFRQLPEDDYIDKDGNKQLGRKSLMLEVLNNGEVDLMPAVVVGGVNAGLDFASTVLTLGAAGIIGKTGLKAFAPLPFMRNVLARDIDGIIRTATPLAVASGVETTTEVLQEVTSIVGVGVSTGYYGNDQKNLKRIFEAGSQAFLTTGPITGGSAAIKVKIDDIKAMKGDRATTRQAINELKRGINGAYKNNEISLKERNDFLEELEQEEQVINKYKEYKEMDVDQKTTVVNENIKIKQAVEEKTKLEAENKTLLKQPQYYSGSPDVVKNKLKIEALQEKINAANIKILQERRIINDKETRKYFVQHVKENPGLYNGAVVLDLGTKERAIKHFKELGILESTPVQRLLNGEVNAFQDGKNVYSIKELRHKIIKKSAVSGYGTSNAFHHDVLHVIQESMTLKEMKEMWAAIEKELKNTKDKKLQEIYVTSLATFETRYGKKFNKTQRQYYMEQMSNLSDAMKEYSLKDLTEVSAMDFGRIANYLSNVFHLKTKVGKNWANFGPENALEHIKEYTNFYGKVPSLRIPKVRGKKDVDLEDKKQFKTGEALESVTIYDDRSLFTLESLVDVIKSPSSTTTQKQLAEKSLLKDYELLALNALGYDTRAGDIARENVLAEARAILPGIIQRFDPSTAKFSTFVDVNLRPKRQQVYEIAKTKDKLETVSLDTKEAKEVADTPTDQVTTEDTFVQKIDVLNDFAITDRVIKDILNIVDVKEGDTFKDIIDKYAGPVGEIIFEIPAKKIMEGGANLIPTTKYKKGMPIPSEAQNIQRFFQAGENMSRFLKTAPTYNVTDKTADIDKIGENIEVSRNVYGVAVGLKGLPLDYLYDNFTDPRSLSENIETRKQAITSPSGRSKGLKSQTQVKKKKPEFTSPKKDIVNKVKADIGITPKNQPNIYNRDIGQLQKGFAKVYSINVALSAAQRNLAKKLAKIDKEATKERKIIKQQIADITTAQSKVAFSEVVDGYIDGYGNVELTLEIEQKIIDAVLTYHLGEKRHTFKTKGEIDSHISDIKEYIIPVLPGNVLTYNTFLNSTRHLGVTKNNMIVVDGKEMKIKDYYKQEIDKLRHAPKDKKIGKGKSFTGPGANFLQGRTYGATFGKTASEIKQAFEKGRKISGETMTVQEINEMNMSMFEQLWQRVNKSIKDTNGKSAKVWANWFSTVSANAEHPHRMGAELVGYSTNPKGYTDPKSGKFKLYEWEHAMPASRAYIYLMHSILGGLKRSNNFKDYNFEGAFSLIENNYKLIALDKYDDQVKLKGAGRTTSMGVGWTLADMWFDRYFDIPVSKIENGIDPKSIKHISGKTFDKVYNVSNRGRISAKIKQNVGKSTRLNNAVNKSRVNSYSEVSRGITVLDFDDTLATTKSGVRATIPNPEGEPKPNRKAILLAGGAGSGKSNVVKQLDLVNNGFKVVNQDIALEWLKKNAGIPTDMRDLTKEQLSTLGKLGYEARMIAKRKYGKFKGRGNGVVVDGTGGSVKTIQRQKTELEAAGYDVQMLFVETSLDVALERNRNRKERSLRDGIVKRNHEAVQNNKSEFKKMFGKGFIEINTDNLKQNDPMPAVVVNKINDFVRGYEKRRLDAEEFAKEGADILAQGGKFDFSEFNVVTEGQTAPLFNKALKLQNKFGNKNMFVLTARPAESATHIHEFLKANGLNIPLKNITGLGNSTAEAKALWMADKVAEGYNDFYFADDALQNVQAVQNMLDQFDVKSKVQQAKVNFSEVMNDEFNKILENVTGIEAGKRFSAIKARKRGEKKGRFRFFIPPSHEDFVGLLYNFIGKGKEGNKHRDFFEKVLIRPLNRADRELNTAKQSIANDYKSLNKQFPDVKKKLTKKTPDGDFIYQDAIRVYLWNKHGYNIPGLSKTDQQVLVDLIMSDPQLQAYAETLNVISKQDAYVNPTESWEAGDIRMDLDDATGRIGREQFFAEFLENAGIIFSQENLNKIEAAYGPNVVSAIKDMLYRIQTGRNRPQGQSKLVNRFLNYLNGSVASTMFFNMRSAVLQQMSMVNFINFGDNNIFAAAKAFSNQTQYWNDWAYIFNSDFMKQRRSGIGTDVNGAELANTIKRSRHPIRALLGQLLKSGFILTQVGDNIAIATGGATYYRNRINTYLKQGLSQKEAEAKAWTDFQVLADATQQSAKPWMVSMQQASPLGKLILAFQNVTSQFNRLAKKAFLDLKNRRISPEYKNAKNPQLQSDLSNVSRIAYYIAIQNLIFYSLQSALFMALFDDNEEDEKWLKKRERMINGSIDSVLRGSGIMGGVIATIKNMAIKWHLQREKGYNADESAVLMEMLNVSPPLGIKARKIVNAEKTLNYNKSVINEMETFDLDNPMWPAITNYIEGTTNAPANRLYNKTVNVRDGLNNQYSAIQRALMFSGYSKWNLGIEDDKVKKIKEELKERKKKEKKPRKKKLKFKKPKLKLP